MTISPSGDVAPAAKRAADPVTLQALVAQRSNRADAAETASKAFTLEGSVGTHSPEPAATRKADPFQKFEAMVLRQFVETMLPDKAESVYGEGVAGDMWKSMMAEHLADTMAARGGIGIATGMLRGHYAADGKGKPLSGISNPTDKADVDPQARPSAAGPMQEMQRNLARSLAAGRLAQVDAGNGI